MPYLPEKKESPVMGVGGVGGGVGSNLVAGAPKEKTYLDDIFSVYTYRGYSNNNRDIINDLDLADKGGMVIQKARDYNGYWCVTDTVRGANNMLRLNQQNANNGGGQAVSQFNANGFNIGDGSAQWNDSSYDYSSWSFCKQKGFFDIVTYEGTGTQTAIEHNLGCMPSMVWVKRLSGSEYFCVWSSGFLEMGYNPSQGYLQMTEDNVNNMSNRFGAPPTATHFTVGSDNQTNSSGSYVAYLFGGGPATGGTNTTNVLANSCDFNGNNQALVTNTTSSEFTASGDWTMECWFKPQDTSGYNIIMDARGGSGGAAVYMNGDAIVVDHGSAAVCQASGVISRWQWYHVAATRSGDDWFIYLNGKRVAKGTYDGSYFNATDFKIGRSNIGGENFHGKITNVRYTNGQVLYTKSFQPSWEPLTTTSQGATASNVKLLCCQNSAVTGATVIPSGLTLTNENGVNVGGWTPFIDKESVIFGEDGDQPVVRSGVYKGNGADLQVDIGFQPQMVMIKRMDNTDEWVLYDQHRNFSTWQADWGSGANRATDAANLSPSLSSNESGRGGTAASGARVVSTPTGFKMLTESNTIVNGNGDDYMWFAVRDIDGQVQKPAESGIDVFAMATGSGSNQGPNMSTRPTNNTGFIRTEYEFLTKPTLNNDKNATQRSINKYNYAGYWDPADTAKGTNTSNDNLISGVFDFENGCNRGGWDSTYQAWMWKKHAGFTSFTYEGTGGSGLRIYHDLGGVPEMIWIKNRVTSDWGPVYHVGANGGVNPEQYYLQLNTSSQEGQGLQYWDNTAPTEYDFTLGNNQAMNWGNEHFCVQLFRSVTGISKVGWYQGSASDQTIPLTFTPRFLLVKASNQQASWRFVDTLRGWGAGNDKVLYMNLDNPQGDEAAGAPETNGFSLVGGTSGWNEAAYKYIYYAHA